MKHSGFSFSLSEIKFELDEQAQESIVNNVTEKVVAAILKALSGKDLLNLSALSAQPLQAVQAADPVAPTAPEVPAAPVAPATPAAPVAPAAIATPPAKRGRRPKVRVEDVVNVEDVAAAVTPVAPLVETPAAVQAPVAVQAPAAAVKADPSAVVDEEFAQMQKISPSLQLKDSIRLRTELTKFKLSQKAQDFFKEIGFNTLYDLLLYKASQKPTTHLQEFTFIDDFLDTARLKVFARQSAVKRYIKGMLKPRRGRAAKAATSETVERQPDAPITKDTLLDALDISTTLRSYLRKEGVFSINDAILYCNEVKLGDLLLKGATNKHSMIYQLVKFLRASGFGTSPMKRFQKKIEEDSATERDNKKAEKAAAKTQETEVVPDYKEELKAANYYNLNDTEMEALFSEVVSYDFPEKMSEVFTKNKIQAMFELLYFVAGISRKFFAEQFHLNINELRRVEKILIDNGFVNPIDKLATMSSYYESKYYHFIRHFRNRIISDKRIPLTRFNKNLTEEEQDALYRNVVDMGFSDRVLSILKHGKIQTTISLLSFMIYGCDTANMEVFTPEVINEITDVLDQNGLNKYKYASYIKGLRKYYFKSSLYFQRKKMEEAAAAAEKKQG